MFITGWKVASLDSGAELQTRFEIFGDRPAGLEVTFFGISRMCFRNYYYAILSIM